MRKLIAQLVIALLLVGTVSSAQAANLTFNKPVSLIGSFGSGSADPQTVVDNVYLPRSTQWQNGTVWWTGIDKSILIDLQGLYQITGLNYQADDNDAYRISYLDENNFWQVAWDNPAVGGWGMQTRPNVTDNSEFYMLTNPIVASQLQIEAIGGDNLYSVSEVQAIGAPVPEPASALMGLIALGGLFTSRRKNKS